MTASSAPRAPAPAKRFGAVDLVTLAALAALFRAMIYIVEAIGFLFPFNTLVLCFGFGLTEMVASRIVRRPGVFTMLNLAGQLINFFLQGEMLTAAILFLLWSVLSDLYVFLRARAGGDPFDNVRDMSIAALLLSLSWPVVTYVIAFPYLYFLELAPAIYWGLLASGIVSTAIGCWLGYGLGDRIKGLIG